MREDPPSGRVVNVLFHGVGRPEHPLEEGEADVWIGIGQFERILDRVRGRPDVQLSFDDGNASDIEVALPRLLERGLRATFFVLAGRLGEPHRLSEGALGELQSAGMTIGSHGWSHRSWRHLDRQAAQQELYDAPALLAEQCQRPIEQAAIPFGLYGRSTLSQLARSGARRVFTSDGGAASRQAWRQARNSVTSAWGESHLDAVLAPREPPVAWLSRRAKRTVKRWR